MRLDDEISAIFKENQHRMTIALLMEVVDELADLLCVDFCKSFGCNYEEAAAKLIDVKLKIHEKLEKERAANAS